jgi:hypothetical protein
MNCDNDYNEWIYTNEKVWDEDPINSKFYVITESEIDELPDDQIYDFDGYGSYLPINLKHLDLCPLIETQTLKGVIANLILSKNFDMNLLIKGINHYLEFDDFLDD